MDFSCPLRPYLLAIPAYTPFGPIDESVYIQRAVMLYAWPESYNTLSIVRNPPSSSMANHCAGFKIPSTEVPDTVIARFTMTNEKKYTMIFMVFTTTSESISIVQMFFPFYPRKLNAFFDRYHQIPVTSSPTSTPTLRISLTVGTSLLST